MINEFIRRTILLLAFLFCSVIQANPVYKVMTEEFNPYSFYQKDGQLTGVAVEITRLLLEKVGHPDNIQVLPWARAVRNIDNKPNHILFSMGRTAEREAMYQWVGPILSDDIYFYQRANNPVLYQKMEQAKNVTHIAVTRDFPEQVILENLDFSNLILTHNPNKSVKMLMASRVTLMAAGVSALDKLVINAGYNPADIKRTDIKLFSTDLYFAFSNNIAKQEIERWQVALDGIKKQNDYQAILSKYKFN